MSDINTLISPRSVKRGDDGIVLFECACCGTIFNEAPRCPECGQLTRILKLNDRKILRVGENLSGLKIFEIINKYFGENYKAWMKASYDINDQFWAWFPTISDKNIRPDGNYGGTVMWSNTVSQDKKVVISVNHDRTTATLSEEERTEPKRNVLIFARIKGSFEFLGVFDDKLVVDNDLVTYRHDRIAEGIDLSTFELIQ